MKKIAFIASILALISACTPSAEKIKNKCLKDKDIQVFYGDQTVSYCDCVYGKLKALEDSSVQLRYEIIDSVKADCDAEYTSLDTNF